MFILKLLARIPGFLLEPLVLCLYYLSWPFTARERSVIVTNAKHVLGYSDKKAKDFAAAVLQKQTLIYLETLKFVFFPDRVQVEGVQAFLDAVGKSESSGSGHVVITAHLGSWELAGHFCAVGAKSPIYVLAKPNKKKWINPILDELRRKLRMHVLWTNSKTLLRDMIKTLDRGEGVGFVMDQRPAGGQGGYELSFLGIPKTQIVTGPALMITKKNTPVVGAYCVRVGPLRYALDADVILQADHGMQDGEAVSKLLVESMERMILKYPEQWAWNYKRWKHAFKC